MPDERDMMAAVAAGDTARVVELLAVGSVTRVGAG